MNAGDVIHIWLGPEHLGGQDAKFKHAVCIDPKERRFLLINSEPRRITPDDNVKIDHAEATFLPKAQSYIDTSRMIGLIFAAYRDGMAKAGAKEEGSLSADVKARILENVAKSKTLPGWQKKLIARQLGAP